jgi:hypothetical protein
MGEKDTAEKLLEDYNDVFADIMNVLVFGGKRRIKASALKDLPLRSGYKADTGRLHEQERDVAKLWKERGIQLCICGIENQTKVERFMPVRILGYEGASYRSQLSRLSKKSCRVTPVVTIVLYFGEEHWKEPTDLKELMDIPEGLEDYENDCKIHVFEISWLTDEQIAMFQSDFRIVANFFVQKRRNKNYRPDDPSEFQHVDETLKLLSVMTGNPKFENSLHLGKGKVKTMCDVADRLIQEGHAEGYAEGEQKLAVLMQKLLTTGRTDDAIKASSDEKARTDFYKEFGMTDGPSSNS